MRRGEREKRREKGDTTEKERWKMVERSAEKHEENRDTRYTREEERPIQWRN